MNKYFIRIDDRQGYLEILRKFINNNLRFKQVLCVKHFGETGENIHYHVACESDYKQQALRKELKKLFTMGKGNGHMSIKDWDGDEKVLSYMFHEDKHEIIYSTYSTDDINKFKDANDIIKDSIKNNCPNNIVRETITRLIEQHKTIRWYDKPEIIFLVWDICKEKGEWYPNKFQLDRWVMKIQAELSLQGYGADWTRCKRQWFVSMYGDPTFHEQDNSENGAYWH